MHEDDIWSTGCQNNLHANIAEDVLAVRVADNAAKNLPGMQEGVTLKEMVTTAVATVIKKRLPQIFE